MSDLRPDPRAAAPIVFDAAGNVLRIDLALLPATTVLLIGGVPVGEVLARAVVAQRRRGDTYRRRALALLAQVRQVREYARSVYQYAAVDRRSASRPSASRSLRQRWRACTAPSRAQARQRENYDG